MKARGLPINEVAALNRAGGRWPCYFFPCCRGQISFMASVVSFGPPILRMGVPFSTGFRSLSKADRPSQRAMFSILDHNQFPFQASKLLQLIHFVTFTSSMASLSQNLSSPRNPQPSNYGSLPVSEPASATLL